MKLAAQIVAGLAVLGLAAPVFAAESGSQTAPAVKTQSKHRTHGKVAQSEQKKAEEKKGAEKKGTEKKAEPGAQKAAPKAEAPAKPAETAPAAPAPAK